MPSKLDKVSPAWDVTSNIIKDIGEIQEQNPKELITPKLIVDKTYTAYVEAQYHGGLSINDIDCVYIKADGYMNNADDLYKQLKSKNVPFKLVNKDGSLKNL